MQLYFLLNYMCSAHIVKHLVHRGEHLFWKAKYLHLTAAASNLDQQKAQVPSETTKSVSLCRNPCPVYRGWQTKRSKNNHDEKK